MTSVGHLWGPWRTDALQAGSAGRNLEAVGCSY